MDESIWYGLAWGAIAAGFQHLHLERSVGRALKSDRPKASARVSWTLLGSMFRLSWKSRNAAMLFGPKWRSHRPFQRSSGSVAGGSAGEFQSDHEVSFL